MKLKRGKRPLPDRDMFSSVVFLDLLSLIYTDKYLYSYF